VKLRPAAFALAFLLVLCSSASLVRAAEAPDWMRAVQGGDVPTDPKLPAIVLLDERSVGVRNDGRTVTIGRYAVRVLTNEGRGYARHSMQYLVSDGGGVREMRAWLIRPSGDVLQYGKDRVLDAAAAGNDVYNEVRIRRVSAVDDAQPGAVFGCEWTLEERPLFPQVGWMFQDEIPVRVSRLVLTLPAGWTAQTATFNHAPIDPVTTGARSVWEMRNLPRIEDEPSAPPASTLSPRVAVTWTDAAGVIASPRFTTWRDVSTWVAGLADPQAAATPALTARARELTAGKTTRLERARAIGRFVQSVQYVSIQTGMGRGGGYRPHAAADVLAKSYGDCKDKANLMRALLAAVDVPAYLVAIYYGDAAYVRDAWPSPQQFNHCIVAVGMDPGVTAGPIVQAPALGPLLLFDPTDPNTPLGDLPMVEQGSLALVVAGASGALVRVPELAPEANRLERTADVALAPDGSIVAELRERSSGQSAVSERRDYTERSSTDYRKLIEGWVSRGATGAAVSDLHAIDDLTAGTFTLDVHFTATRYAQLVQQQLLVFKPALVSRRDVVFPTGVERKYPVLIRPSALDETILVKLPEGFAVDEMPTPAHLETGFGSYATTYAVENGELRFTRRMRLTSATIPVEKYPGVREFFEQVRASDQAAVVLAKK
jgi:Domain of Unknown Function with PDB structure (DUF3857)/Transglutaminase-like superfamily